MQEIVARLDLVFDWYEGKVSPETGRFVYSYDPRPSYPGLARRT